MNRSEILRPTLAQAAMEVRLTLRRGESVLVTVIIPVALMAFFASARVLPTSGRSISFLLPGTVTLAVISTWLVPVAHVLPADPLATLLRAALSSHLHMPWISAAILAAWAIAAPLVAIATFQWE